MATKAKNKHVSYKPKRIENLKTPTKNKKLNELQQEKSTYNNKATNKENACEKRKSKFCREQTPTEQKRNQNNIHKQICNVAQNR